MSVQSPYPTYAAMALGSVITIQSITTMINPVAGITAFGLPLDRTNTQAISVAYSQAARQAIVGATVVLFGLCGERRALRLMTLVWCAIGMIDLPLMWNDGLPGKFGSHVGGISVLCLITYFLHQ